AVLLEGARAVAWRLDFSRQDFHRISDLCAVVSAGSAGYLLTAGAGARMAGAPGAPTVLFQWLPLLVAPLVACQAYSTAGKVDLGAFFWAYRRKAAGERAPSTDALDLAYPYAVLCVLSAGAANVRTPAYFAGVCLLTAWALWVGRSPAGFAVGAGFTPVQPEAGGETWKLAPGPASEASVGVSMYLPRGRGVLALLARAMEIDKLAVVRLSKNSLGAVRVDEGLGLV